MVSNKRGRSNKKKGWKKVQINDVDDFLYTESLKAPISTINQSNIESLYEISTLPSSIQIKNSITHNLFESNYYKYKENTFASYSYNALKQIAPNSYGTLSQNYLSSEDECPNIIQKMPNKYRPTENTRDSVFVSEDIWASCSGTSKRANKTKKSLPEFKPHPPASGLSYNPDFKEYEKYVNNAASFDLLKDKKFENSKNKSSKNYSQYNNSGNDMNTFVIAMAGDYHVPDENDSTQNEPIVVPIMPNRMKAKSKKEKIRKRIQKKKTDEQLRLNSIEKNQRKDVHHLKSIQSLVSANEKALAVRQKLRQRKINIREKQELLKKTLPPVSEIPLPEELTGCLRTVTPTMSILDNKSQHIRASKLIVKRKKKALKRSSLRKVYSLPNKIMQDLN